MTVISIPFTQSSHMFCFPETTYASIIFARPLTLAGEKGESYSFTAGELLSSISPCPRLEGPHASSGTLPAITVLPQLSHDQDLFN
jgi:hypothetical protein